MERQASLNTESIRSVGIAPSVAGLCALLFSVPSFFAPCTAHAEMPVAQAAPAPTAELAPGAAAGTDKAAPGPGAPTDPFLGASPAKGSAGGQEDKFLTGGASQDVTSADCEATNRSMWIGVAAIDILTLLLFFLTFAFVASRSWLKLSALGTFFVILSPFASIGGAVVGTFRPAKEVVGLCLENPELRHLVKFAEFAGWQRGTVLGAVPIITLAFVLKMLHAVARPR